MRYTPQPHWSDREIVGFRAIWSALALSLLVHIAALWAWLPRMHALTGDLPPAQVAAGSLAVQLAPRRSDSSPQAASPSTAASRLESPVPPARRSPRPAIRKPAAPPVIATAPPQSITVPPLPQSTPTTPPPAVEPAPAPASPPRTPPIESDLSAYIAARRHERGEAAPPLSAEERERARRDKIVSANLASVNAYGSGTQSHAGGVFAIVRIGESDGEFVFHGWNGKIHGQLSQRVEVQRGSEKNIRVAMIRRMIAIIREYEHTDFVWESKRLGRDVTLSARMSNNDELEAFLYDEFFDANGQPR